MQPRGQEQGEELTQLLEAGLHHSVLGVKKRQTRPSVWRTQPGEREARDVPRSESFFPNAWLFGWDFRFYRPLLTGWGSAAGGKGLR